MDCGKVRLTEICKTCGVGNIKADCPTYREEDDTSKYAIPPFTVFNLVPYKNHVGELVVYIGDSDEYRKRGEIFTVIEQVNGRIRLGKFKDHTCGLDYFRRLKAIYNGIEYTIRLQNKE
jgi:hypothetical protein